MSELAQVTYDDVELVEAFLGYDILVDGEYAGVIEGVPGSLDYIELELHWEGQGVGRAAVQQFVALSRHHGESVVRTTNATSDAMEHILQTEGFQPVKDDSGWAYTIEACVDEEGK